MADVNISKYRASVVRDGSKPASPGFIVSEGQDPVDPAGTGQNHLPVTIAPTATGLSITDSQILSGAGTVGQYIRGDGSLADFPSASGGGSSVSYYLNGSVNQGTIGGVAYKELSKVPVLGTGTDFTINADGYIASFLTDAGDPNLLEIPGGNWNFETYFSASSSGGTPTFYVELYKYDGSTFTLLASNSGAPEFIAFGTTLTSYFSTLAVPTTTLALTDRLAIRYYVTHSGRTITLHTEDNHLCQVITTFTTGLTALNGLTAQVQNFAVGTSGTDFNIASATATHTFNLPTASATNRGALSSADWTTFNNKQNALGYVPVPETRTLTINGTAFDLSANRSWIVGDVRTDGSYSNPSWITALAWSKITGTPTTLSGYGITDAVPSARTLTINGVTQDLSANRTFNVGTVTSVGLSSATSGVTIGGSPVTGVGAFTLTIATASGSQQGLLSAADWTTFNNKQNALTNPVTGTGTTNYLAKFTGSTTVGNSQVFDNGTNVGIGTIIPSVKLHVQDTSSQNPSLLVLEGSNSGRGLEIRLATDGLGAAGSAIIYNTRVSAPYGEHIWQQAGTQRMRLDTSGNLGLGVTPSTRLHVVGGSTTTGIANAATTVTSRIDLANPAITLGFGYVASDIPMIQSLNNGTNSATALTINPFGGNLLVGTTSDNGARLQVSGTATFSNRVFVDGNLSGNNIAFLKNASSNGYGLLIQGGTSTNYALFITDYIGNQIFQMLGNGAAAFSSSVAATELFLSTSNGLIGSINSSNANGGYITWQTSGTTIADIGTAQQIFGSGGNDTFGINGRGARALTFGTNNTERLRITSSGNVGIGTTSPSSRLHVSGTSSNTESGQIRITNIGQTFQIGYNTSSDYGYLNIYNAGLGYRALAIQPDGGNLLVGTTSDNGARLQVSGAIYASDELYLDNGKYLRFRRSSGNLSIQTLGIPSGTDDVRLLTTGDFNVLNGSLTNLMTVKNNGNVLIGTTTDIGQRLQVSGGYIAQVDGGVRTFLGYDGSGSLIGTTTNHYFRFITNDTERMRITSGGNVLIGTTTDNSHKLRVNGTGYFDTGIKTGNPVGSTTNDWLLGRALVTGTSTPDRWIRVQIGNLYYDILAVYMGSV